MNTNKKLLLIVGSLALAAIVVVFVFTLVEKKQIVKETNNVVPSSQSELVTKETANKEDDSSNEEEMYKEKPADPALVNVSSASGVVIEINEKEIALKNGEKEEKFALLAIQEGLGVFKKTGNEVTFLNLSQIKAGDKVYLEFRQSDKKVNTIVVE